MARTGSCFVLLVILTLSTYSTAGPRSHASTDGLLPIVDDDGERTGFRIYTVYLDEPVAGKLLRSKRGLEKWHLSFLPNATIDSGEPRLVYSFRHVITGFIARLTPQEARVVEAMEGVLDAVPDDVLEDTDTTYTPEYLGLNERDPHNWKFPNQGEHIVIGIVDTGLTPGHPSFDDNGMAGPPPKWVGRSCGPDPLYCNKKVLRAVAFPFTGTDSPVDSVNHGTGVAGIAAGNIVDNVDVGGQGRGNASGMAPRAHLVMYKWCSKNKGCSPSNRAAGIDQAVADEVDLINMSISPIGAPVAFHRYPPTISSFDAMKKGILSVTGTGNSGPKASTVNNVAPWELVVGASMTDRTIDSTSTRYGVTPHPKLASLSSRGPVSPAAINGGLIKPDVIAPGHNIVIASKFSKATNPKFSRSYGTSLAAPHVAGIVALLKVEHPGWSPAAIKSAIMTTASWLDDKGNPIKKQLGGDASIHDIGAGHVNATRANNPGLVYDLTADDYYPYLCGLGYQNWQVRKFAKKPIYCQNYKNTGAEQLNLPSIAISLPFNSHKDVTVKRTLTNVEENMTRHEDYKANIVGLHGVHWQIKPDNKLKFHSTGQKYDFEIEFKKHHHHIPAKDSTSEGYLIWESEQNNEHKVRSPIVVTFT